MSRKTNILTIAGLGMTATLALSLGGCKKPPPPITGACCTPDGSCSVTVQTDCAAQWRTGGSCSPNPCPAPPPPPDIALETVAQDMKADPRVQFAAEMKLPEEKLDLAKAIIKLADSLAKGDAKAMKPLLTRRAQALLADLQNSGGWEEATKQVEQVRIVLIRDGVDFGAVGAAKIPEGEITGNLMSKVMEMMKGIPPDQMMAISKAAQEAMAGMDPAALAKDPSKIAEFQAKITEAMKAAGVSEEMQQKLAELGKPAEGAPVEAASASSVGTGVLIAIQDIHGSYVLGWDAQKIGDTWAFNNAPSTADIRARASMWDGVGTEAFQAMQLASLPTAPRSGEDGAPGTNGGSGGGGGGGEGGSPAPSAPAPSNPSPVPAIPNGPHGKHPRG